MDKELLIKLQKEKWLGKTSNMVSVQPNGLIR